MKIGLTYNVKPASSDATADLYAEHDSPEVITAIKEALETSGHTVFLIEADEKVYQKVFELKDQLNIVFNIAEGFSGESREAQIPAMLDMLKIPYSGSGVLPLTLTLNKAFTKEILTANRIRTPRFQLFDTGKEKLSKKLVFPLIVKPNTEGSSKGIKNDCVVKNENDLYNKINEIIRTYNQPAIAEEFLTGREFTVAMIGNEKPDILPIVEVKFDFLPPEMNKFDSYESKWIYDNPDSKVGPLTCPAKIDAELEKKIKNICVNTFRALRVKDWCRIDLRLDEKGEPNILEVNALPGISPEPKINSRFPRAAFAAGMSYKQLITRVLETAVKRLGINPC